MALIIDDGYTLPFSTLYELDEMRPGEPPQPLPLIEGVYRPPTFAERQAYLFAVNRATTGEQEAQVIADFIASRVARWDVSMKTPTGFAPAPITAEMVKRLPEQHVGILLRRVSRWGPNPRDSQERDAGN